MYLTTAGPYLGWAYLPDIVNKGNAYLAAGQALRMQDAWLFYRAP
jgi:hypothetical protein